ncbi:glycosyltransferase family 2 protein [Streptococcus sp. sy018]|nr:glycosyltransferase family 2 protein [Streptococcus sp. sy018]
MIVSQKLVSFIIPVNRLDQIIRRTLYSIINACSFDLSMIEILIVENGKAISLSKTLQDVLESYPDLIVLLQSKEHVSAARNIGIQHSRGRWLVFVDADDELVPQHMSELVQELQNSQADFLVCDFFKSNQLLQLSVLLSNKTLEEQKRLMISKPTLFMTVWNKCFSREFIIKQQIFFDERLRLAEDGDFMLNVLSQTRGFKVFAHPYYRYYQHSQSTMGRFDDKSKDYIQAMVLAKEKYSSLLTFQGGLEKYILTHLNLILVRETFNYQNNQSFRDKKKALQVLMEHPIFRTSLSRLSISSCVSLYYLTIVLLKLRCHTLVGVACTLKSYVNSKRIT